VVDVHDGLAVDDLLVARMRDLEGHGDLDRLVAGAAGDEADQGLAGIAFGGHCSVSSDTKLQAALEAAPSFWVLMVSRRAMSLRRARKRWVFSTWPVCFFRRSA